jgi:enamine deaminase RidA (YjgF/YER057c/UK114 family)
VNAARCDASRLAAFNAARSFAATTLRWAGEARPARAVVPVPQLHYGFKIEVEATALV